MERSEYLAFLPQTDGISRFGYGRRIIIYGWLIIHKLSLIDARTADPIQTSVQRINSRNTLPTVLTGEFRPQETGTRVKRTFDLETTSKIAICLFSAVGLLIL